MKAQLINFFSYLVHAIGKVHSRKNDRLTKESIIWPPNSKWGQVKPESHFGWHWQQPSTLDCPCPNDWCGRMPSFIGTHCQKHLITHILRFMWPDRIFSLDYIWTLMLYTDIYFMWSICAAEYITISIGYLIQYLSEYPTGKMFAVIYISNSKVMWYLNLPSR